MEPDQDGEINIQHHQFKSFFQKTGLFHPPTERMLDLLLNKMVILNHSLLVNKSDLVKLLQLEMSQQTQISLPEPQQEISQDGDQDIQSSQQQRLFQKTRLCHPLTESLPVHLLLPTVILNHSLLNLSLMLPQPPTSQLTQHSLPVQLQEISQDGDLDIQSSQQQRLFQKTRLCHPLTENLPVHLLLPTVILNHSLPEIMLDLVKLPQPQTSQLTQHLLPVPLQETSQDGDLDIQKSQHQLFFHKIRLCHLQTERLPDHLLLLTVILNPSLLVIMSDSVKSLQPPTSQQTQLLPPVLLQAISQDGDQDIQKL